MIDNKLIEGRKGGSTTSTTPTNDPDSAQSIDYINCLIALGEGEVEGTITGRDIMFDGTPLLTDEGVENFPGTVWEFRSGTQDQEYIQGFPDTRNSISVSQTVTASNPFVRSISTPNLSAIGIQLKTNAFYNQQDDGKVTGTRVEYAVDLSTDGGQYSTVNSGAFDFKASNGYSRSLRIDLPSGSSSWAIRVRRITADSDPIRVADVIQVASYTEIIDEKFRHPLTALLFIRVNAKLFPNGLPTISTKKKWLLLDVPSNYDPISRTYSGAWDGTFKEAWSNNPAWVTWKLINNERYGMNQRELGIPLDKWNLYNIGQRCDDMVPDGQGGMEPRHLCDMYIQDSTEAYNVVRDLCSIYRGMSFYDGENLSIVIDEPRDPVYLFTNDNVVNGYFDYQSPSEKTIYTTAYVSFDDELNSYKTDIEAYSDPKISIRHPFKPLKISAVGTVRRSEARRRGKWAVKTNNTSDAVSFQTGLEGFSLMQGDVISVADSFYAVVTGQHISARCAAYSGRVVTADRELRISAGDRLIANLITGGIEGRTVSSVATTQNSNGDTVSVITLNTAYSEDIEPDTVLAVDGGDLALQQFIVVDIQRGDEDDSHIFTITATMYDAAKYIEVDDTGEVTERPTTVIPALNQAAPQNVTINTHTSTVQGLAVQAMTIAWDETVGAVGYEAQWRKDNGNWINAAQEMSTSTSVDVNDIYAGVYQARVRAMNSGQVWSQWSDVAIETLSGKDGAPGKIPLLTTETKSFAIGISWVFPDNSDDTGYTEIQYSENSQGTDPQSLTLVPYPQQTYDQTGLLIGKEFWYRARIIDRIGNVGPWSDNWVYGVSSTDVSDIFEATNAEWLASDEFKLLQDGIASNAEDITEQQSQIEAQMAELERQNEELQRQATELQAQAGELQDQATQISQNAQDIANEAIARANADSQLNTQIVNVQTQVSDLDQSVAEELTLIKSQLGNETFEALRVWNFDNDAESFSSSGDITHNPSGTITLTPTNNDPYLVSPAFTDINGGLYPYVSLRIRRVSGDVGAWNGQIHFADADHGFVSSYTGTFVRPTNDTEWNVISVEMPESWKTSTTVRRIRPDISGNSTEVWEIDWIAIGRRSVGTSITAIDSLRTTVTQQGDTITSQGTAITGLQNQYTDLTSDVEANASAINSLQSTVTSQGNTLTSHGSAITSLQNGLSSANGSIAANSSAISSLLSTVTQQGNDITSQGQSIVSLNNSVTTAQNTANAAQTAAQNAATDAGNKGKVIYGSSAPATEDRLAQNLWIDTTGNANTPKRWNGSAWVVVTDKAATDAAAAAAAAQATANTANTKADANSSAISSLTSRVTSAEGSITSQGQNITTLTNTVTRVGQKGSNLINDASFEDYTATGGILRSSSVTGRNGSKCAQVVAGSSIGNNDFTYSSQFATSEGRVFYVEAWIRTDPNTAVAISAGGQLAIGLWLQTSSNANVWQPAAGATVGNLTESWDKISGYITIPANIVKATFWGRMPGNSNAVNSSILIDAVFAQDVTEGRNAVVESAANSSAITSLTSRVTESENNITSQSQNITALQNNVSDIYKRGDNLIINGDFSNGLNSWGSSADNVVWSATSGENGTPGITISKTGTDSPQMLPNNSQWSAINVDAGPRRIRVSVRAKGISGACNLMLRLWRNGQDGGTASADSPIFTFSTAAFETKSFDVIVPNPRVRMGLYCYNQVAVVAVTEVSMSDVTDAVQNAANSSAISSLQSTVTSQGNTLSSHSSSITSLNNSVTTAQNTANTANTKSDANASAITSLTSRVSSAEGQLSSNSSSITSLQNNISYEMTKGNNLIRNPGFDSGTSLWFISNTGSSTISWGSTTGEYSGGILITRVGGANPWISSNNNQFVTVTPGRRFRISIRVAGVSGAYQIMARLYKRRDAGTETYEDVIFTFASQPGWGTHTHDYAALTEMDTKVMLRIYGYPNDGVVRVSNVSLFDITDTVQGEANSSAISSLTSTVTQQGGQITAQASSLSSLTSTVNGHTSSIQTIQTTTTNLSGTVNALYTVRVATSGSNSYVSGMQLGASNAGSFAAFLTDQFRVAQNLGGTPQVVFQVVNGQTQIVSALIGDATITSAKIANGAIGRLQIANTISSDNYVANSTGMQINFATGQLIMNGTVSGQGRLQITNNRIVSYDANGQVAAVMGQKL